MNQVRATINSEGIVLILAHEAETKEVVLCLPGRPGILHVTYTPIRDQPRPAPATERRTAPNPATASPESEPQPEPDDEPPVARCGRGRRPGPCAGDILLLLADYRHRSAREIHRQLHAAGKLHGEQTIRDCLSRLADAGAASVAPDGRYTLSDD